MANYRRGSQRRQKGTDVSSIITLRLKWWPDSEATDKHMQIYFDESGDFNTARNSAYKFAFVVGIILPDRALQRLKADFDWFVGQLSSNEFRPGEPKGALLSLTHRQVLLEILKAHSDVINNLKTESSSMTIRERAALAKRFGRLSAPVMARLVSYGIAVLKAIESIACRYYCDQFRSDYDPITLIFDRTGRARNREELLLEDSLFGWIANLSRTVPLRIPSSLNDSHPLLAKYGERKSE